MGYTDMEPTDTHTPLVAVFWVTRCETDREIGTGLKVE